MQRTVEPAPDSPIGLGLEVRGDGLTVVVADAAGRIYARSAVATLSHVRRPELVLDELADMAQAVIREIRRLGLPLLGATVAVADELGWIEREVRATLQARLPLPIAVDSSGALGALGELSSALGARVPDCAYISGGREVTAHVIADGQVQADHVHGVTLAALGHVCVDHRGRWCVCGRRGCLQEYVQRASLLRDAGLAGGDVLDLLEYARAGEPRALAALADCGRWLGIALAGVVNLIAPPALVLGGDFATFAPWIVPAIGDELEGRVLGSDQRWPTVVVSRLGEDAAVVGAALASVAGATR
ncbi:putative NBD/HSP70 family sugar kinase [Solirubrobacter pauli]|uniref:Putative NBD/HSP70 family sugar kinase n=1 Tax=Solirubrobacter pauli TaxID=166793 RepID=A0A660LGA9_9ACTN|nr:ROK family protein [Solirubrobacter pauli]RKQ93215.1 putative NBD/HSP70 family sugar kinase [Solirubrobacter pauli]